MEITDLLTPGSVIAALKAQGKKQLLQELAAKARGEENLMPALVDAAKAYCTLGEISDVLREAWGEFQQPVVF